MINYIKMLFCNHKFIFSEAKCEEYVWDYVDEFESVKRLTRNGTRVSQTCEKCGFHRSYWKY